MLNFSQLDIGYADKRNAIARRARAYRSRVFRKDIAPASAESKFSCFVVCASLFMTISSLPHLRQVPSMVIALMAIYQFLASIVEKFLDTDMVSAIAAIAPAPLMTMA